MLAESDRELLTAYVDNELSTRQRKAVLRLLRRSNEAKTLLNKLQDDARRLRGLPRRQLPADFSGRVFQTIAQRGTRPGRRDPTRQPPAVPIWTALAAAASVLLIVGAATFYLFAVALNHQDRKNSVAAPRKDIDNKDGKPVDVARDAAKINDSVVHKDGEREPPKDRGPAIDKVPPVVVKDGNQPPDQNPVVKAPDPKDPSGVLTAPGMENVQPDSVEVILPELFRLKDVSVPGVHDLLLHTLARQDAFYIEVLCKDGTIAFPRVQAAFKAIGIDLIVDSQAQARLKATQFRSNYAMLAEDLTRAEVAQLFEQLGKEETDRKKPGFGQFASSEPNLIITPLTPEVRKKLSAALGHDTKPIPPPVAVGPFGIDLYRPLADQTADQVVRALSSSSKKGTERFALGVPHGLVQQSPEIKQFFASRQPVRKDTVQIYLVLRGKP